MQPTSVENIMQSLPHSKKIITDYNEIIVENIKEFDFYINENLLHIFVNDKSNIIEIISAYTNNFCFKECDIKDAYLFKIKNDEEVNLTLYIYKIPTSYLFEN